MSSVTQIHHTSKIVTRTPFCALKSSHKPLPYRRTDGQTDRQTRRRQRRGKVEEEMHNSFMRWPKGICIFHGTLSCYVVDRQGSWPKTDKRRTHKGSLLANDAHYGQSGVHLSLRVLRNGVDKISASSNDCQSGGLWDRMALL